MASPNTEQMRLDDFREAVARAARRKPREARPRDRSLRGKARRIARHAASAASRLTQERTDV